MQQIRFFFSKQGEAAYISHLDLQRVMARALRRSAIPVWYSQGFNPHIYITFSLPLPLMQESVVETMDCKTESEEQDFAQYLPRLNQSLPRGITISHINTPVHDASEIAFANYNISWDYDAKEFAKIISEYNALEEALVLRKTKRTQQMVNLKEYISSLEIEEVGECLVKVKLPAGSNLNYNPELLLRFLEESYNLPAAKSTVVRTKISVLSGEEFR